MNASIETDRMRSEEKCNQLEKKEAMTRTIEKIRERETSSPKRKYHHRIISNKKSVHTTVGEDKEILNSQDLEIMMLTE
jgi:hypothetical protein